MTLFLQMTAAGLVAVILCAVLNRQARDVSILLGLAVCGILLAAACTYLEPVVAFVQRLQEISGMDSGIFGTVLKCAGIGLIAEIASMICADAGNGAIGKSVEMVASAAILWLSLPLMTALLELVQQMVGKV